MRLAAIHVHPVKSCRGVVLPSARVGPLGLDDDRVFAVVDGGGDVLTQRTHPRLARVDVVLGSRSLRVAAAGHGHAEVALHAAGPDTAKRLAARLHGEDVEALHVGQDRADSWFSALLDLPARLVRLDPDRPRRRDARRDVAPRATAFADAEPVSVIGTASLAALNLRLDVPVPMLRFRPNLVIATDEPHVEDSVASLRVGDLVLDRVGPIARCVMTCIDPTTAERGPEPLRALATYRRAGSHVTFGSYFVPRREAVIAVDDAVAAPA